MSLLACSWRSGYNLCFFVFCRARSQGIHCTASPHVFIPFRVLPNFRIQSFAVQHCCISCCPMLPQGIHQTQGTTHDVQERQRSAPFTSEA